MPPPPRVNRVIVDGGPTDAPNRAVTVTPNVPTVPGGTGTAKLRAGPVVIDTTNAVPAKKSSRKPIGLLPAS